MESNKKIVSYLKSNDFFYIITHMYPDGDALGSAFGLCLALQRLGKHAKVLNEDDIPKKFRFLYDYVKKEDFECKSVISVDLAEASLLRPELKIYEDKIDVCIDHHKVNKFKAPLSCINSSAAACCEIIYRIIKDLGVDIDKEIAACLYTGISTDTGCFEYSNTSADSHYIAAKLMECGAPVAKINESIFTKKSRIKLETEKNMYKNLVYFFSDKCAITHISINEMEKIGITDNELDGIASIPIKIEGVEIGITLREKVGGIYKASVRTSENIDASKFCEYFQGGGHQRAAGFTINGDVSEIYEKINDVLIHKFGWKK